MCLVLKGGSLQRKCIPSSNLMHLSHKLCRTLMKWRRRHQQGVRLGAAVLCSSFSPASWLFSPSLSLCSSSSRCVCGCVFSLESLFGKIQAVVQTGSTRILQIKCIAVSNHYLCSCMVAERVGTSTVARTRRSMNKVIYVLPSSWFSISLSCQQDIAVATS